MSRSSPRDVAERCFALARSSTFPAEREAAISRGTAICRRAGLDLDGFDVPGRVKARPHPAADRHAGGGPAEAGAFSGRQYARDEYAELMRSFRRHMAEGSAFRRAMDDFGFTMEKASAAAGARADETVYDARRRNFDEAASAAQARDAARDTRS